MFKAYGLTSHIQSNNAKSVLLLAGFPLLLFIMIFAFSAGMYGFGMAEGKPVPWGRAITEGWGLSLEYGWVALALALGWFSIAYFFHTKMIQMASGAVPVDRTQEPKLYNMMENLCISRGLPMPSFQIIESDALNAFASGINQKTYAITVTRGLLNKLEDDEVEAVLAHELTHILNKDVRLLIVSVVFVGMISFFAEMTFRQLIYGGRYRRRSSNSKDNRGAILILALAILVIGYIFAILIRFALSRKREYLADAGAVELTKNPEAMMRALQRISGKDAIKDLPEDVEMMCIENSTGFMHVFATHPPIERRIEAISQMTDTEIPAVTARSANSKSMDNPWK